MKHIKECPLCGSQDHRLYLETQDWFLTMEAFSIQECNACAFLFTNPIPEEMGSYYQSEDYLSHNASKKGLLSTLYRIIRLIALKKKYHQVKKHATGKNLLDIGCGTGEFLNYCQIQGMNTKGIEPGKQAREFAKKQYNLEIDDEPALDNLPAGQYDVITLWHVLEHVPNLHQRMKTITSLIKDQGIIILALPNPQSFDAEKYEKFWAAYDTPRHLYHFRKKNIETLAQQHNLKLLETVPMPFDAYYISLLSEKYKTGSQNFLKATINGCKSNMKGAKSKNHSSLTYILQKK